MLQSFASPPRIQLDNAIIRKSQRIGLTTPNPYAPTVVSDPDLAAAGEKVPVDPLDLLRDLGPINFAGAATEDDLANYLHKHENPGISTSVTAILAVLVCSGIVFAAAGVSAAPLIIGMAGVVTIAMLVSTRFYRKKVFQDEHLHWGQTIVGEASLRGLRVQRGAVDYFSDWELVRFAKCDQDIAWIELSLPRNELLLLSPAMVVGLEEWDRLQSLLNGLVHKKAYERRAGAEYLAGRLMGMPNRRRGIEVPEDAIEFQGPIYRSDFDFLPRLIRRPTRPTRAVVVRICLMVFSLMILVGVVPVGLQSQQWFLWLVMAYLIALLARKLWRWKTENSGDALVYVLSGYANEDHIALDYDKHTVKTQWSNLRISQQNDDRIVLMNTNRMRILLLQASLTPDRTNWKRLVDLINRKLANAKHDDALSQR